MIVVRVSVEAVTAAENVEVVVVVTVLGLSVIVPMGVTVDFSV